MHGRKRGGERKGDIARWGETETRARGAGGRKARREQEGLGKESQKKSMKKNEMEKK